MLYASTCATILTYKRVHEVPRDATDYVPISVISEANLGVVAKGEEDNYSLDYTT